MLISLFRNHTVVCELYFMKMLLCSAVVSAAKEMKWLYINHMLRLYWPRGTLHGAEHRVLHSGLTVETVVSHAVL